MPAKKTNAGRTEVRHPSGEEDTGSWTTGRHARIDAHVVDRHQHHDQAANEIQRGKRCAEARSAPANRWAEGFVATRSPRSTLCTNFRSAQSPRFHSRRKPPIGQPGYHRKSNVDRRAEVRWEQRRGRYANPPGRRAHHADEGCRATTSRWSSRPWVTPRTSCWPCPPGVAQSGSARARHAAVCRRAHFDGAAVDGHPRAGRRRDQLHREPVGHHHQRSPRRCAHHRGAAVPRPGRTLARTRRRDRRLPGRVVPPRGDDAGPWRQRYDRGGHGCRTWRRVVRDLF